MLSEDKAERNQMKFFCIDSFVPQDHLLRKIEEAVNFSKLYEIDGDLYCHNNGRTSVDPVVLFKIVFITPEYKELYAHRKETVERVFADAKEKHGKR